MKMLLFIAGWLCIPFLLQAQQTNALPDSLQAQQETHLRMMQSEQQLDSLKQQEIQQELNRLPATGAERRHTLENDLDVVRRRQEVSRRQLKQHVDSLRSHTPGYPVVPFRDTLFWVYYRSGSIPPAERATTIAERIRKLGNDYFFAPDSLRIVRQDGVRDIMYRDFAVVSVSDMDVLWAGMDGDSLSKTLRNRIAAAVIQHREETSWLTIVREIGYALLVLAGMGVVIWIINRLFKKIHAFLLGRKQRWFRGIRVKTYELFTPDRELALVTGVLQVVKWGLIIVAIYIALPLLFSIFPGTRDIAERLISYLISPVRRILLAFWHYLPDLFTIAVVVFVFYYVLKLLRFLKTEVEKGVLVIPGFYADWANPTYQIIRILILAFMLVIIFPYLPGSDSPVFKGVSVFLGFLFTFGSAGSLSNVIAGIVLTYMRLFKLGDRVQVGEVTGDVIEKSLLVTRIRTPKNEVISIPNSMVMSGHTVNYSSDAQAAGLILHTTVTIGYDAPWRKVHELLVSAALATRDVVQQPEPFVLQTALNDFYVSYELNAYTRNPNGQAAIYSELHQHIQDKFNEAGVEIMSPHYRAMRDGNQVSIPPDYLPPDYEAPGFKWTREDKPDTAGR